MFLESEFTYADKSSSSSASIKPVLQKENDLVTLDDEFQDRPPSEILDIAEPTGLAESRSDFPSPAVSSSYAGKETPESENGGVDEDNTLPPSPDNFVTFAENTEAPTVSSVQTSQPAQSPQQM